MKRGEESADHAVAGNEAVELVAVNGDVADAVKFPGVFLIDADADQMRHDLGQAVVMIAFDPDDFDLALGIGEFADVSEKLPVLFFQAREIQVGKNVAQQDEAIEGSGLQQTQRGLGAADFGAEVQVGKDKGVGENHLAKLDSRGGGMTVCCGAALAVTGTPIAAAADSLRCRISSRNSGISNRARLL